MALAGLRDVLEPICALKCLGCIEKLMNGHLNPLHGNTNRKINEKKLLKTDCGPLMEGHCTLMQVLVEQTEHVSVKRVCSCRFHYDDATAFHQLQVEVCCSFAMAHADLQGTQHVH